MGSRQEWICRGEVQTRMSNFDAEELAANPCGSFFTLTFWPEGTVSGLRVKPLSDPPGLMKFMENSLSWKLTGMEEQADIWDVVGKWDNYKICLQLLPRRGGSPVLLSRGEREFPFPVIPKNGSL